MMMEMMIEKKIIMIKVGNFWLDVMAFMQIVTIDTRLDSLTAYLFAGLFVFPGMERRVGKGGPRHAQSKCLFILFTAWHYFFLECGPRILCKCQRVLFLYDMLIFSNFRAIVESRSWSRVNTHYILLRIHFISLQCLTFFSFYSICDGLLSPQNSK